MKLSIRVTRLGTPTRGKPASHGLVYQAVAPLVVVLLFLVAGCSFAPSKRFAFDAPAGFAIDAEAVSYDDDSDGVIDRTYRFADYADAAVPHVIILLDSVPFSVMAERYAKGDFAWMGRPVKMIAPFPSLTEICYTEIFNAPPLPGVTDTQYDPRLGESRSDLWSRVRGTEQPWERRAAYHASYDEHGLSFLDPRAWYAAELRRAYEAIEASPDRVTYVYFASAASMACKYGRAGIEEVLDGARQLCLRLLYERRGAVRISMMADHGHNLVETKNVTLDKTLQDAGFKVRSSLKSADDVVISINGLVTTAAIHTQQPARVAEALVKNEAVELAIYRDQARTIIRSRAGMAAIETQGDRYRYVPIDADVLGYGDLVPGFATETEWLARTIDHEYPNAPARLSAAMTRLVVSTPSVLVSIRDGYSTGEPEYEKWIDMKSTHGGLNQINCATFVMSMTGRLKGPVLPRDVLKVLEPNERPRVLR